MLGSHLHFQAEVLEASIGRPFLSLVFQIDPALVRQVSSDMLERRTTAFRSRDAEAVPAQPACVSAMDTELLGVVMRFLHAVGTDTDRRVLAPLYLRELVYRVLQREQYARLLALAAAEAASNPVSAVLEYVRGHMSEPLTVADMADLVCLSPSAFAHLFRDVTGRSPYQFVKEMRLDRARELLVDGNFTMARISKEVGYAIHYPDEDKDYLASVVRTFAHDVDDIRLTLHQNTELGLAAARRVAALLQANGRTAAEAHRIVSAAAKTAWRQDRQFADVLAEDTSHGLTRAQIQREVDAQRADSQRLSDARRRTLEEIPGFQHPVALSALTDAEMGEFDAVFAPGGHGPMVDLADNPDVGRLLAALHKKHAPIAALCHGPAVLLSAPERADGLWLFDGYRMTAFTDEEEDQTEAGLLGMAWLLDVALKNAGAVFDDGPSAWISHVVVDRNLVTGQNPGSTEATADAVIKKLRAPARQAA